MFVKDFNDSIEKQIEKCRSLLIDKAKEYATEDRLHNFHVAAELSGKSPEECLGGMMIKHTVSVYDMLSNSSDYSSEMWEEKITDHINYLLILKAMLDDVRRPSVAINEWPINERNTVDL
jgi:hypothetical protein